MKGIKLVAIILVTSIGFASAQPKEPVTDFGKMYLPIWLEAKRHCLDVATTMPENLYSYKPTEVSKTFAEQMVHIAYTVELLCKRYVQGMEVTSNPPDASKMTKAEIVEMLNKGFDYVTQVIYTVPQSKLDETCKMYHSGNTVSRALGLVYVQDHMANHRSKANLYIRMNNIQPPEYTW
ncbi:MAG: DinB family protein [Cyclobacteriaceae bacterium]